MPLFTFRPKARRGVLEVVSSPGVDQISMQPVKAQIVGGRSSNSLGYANFADTTKQVTAAALVTAGIATIWTPAGGNILQLQVLRLTVTVAGSWRVRYNGVIIFDEVLPASFSGTVFAFFPGVFLYPTASPLDILNNTGSTSLVTATAMGSEVLP